MFGDGAMRRTGDWYSLAVGLSRFDVITLADLASEFGDAAPAGDGRDEYMAALTIRTRSLDGAAAALQRGNIGGVKRTAERIIVPATETFGVTLEFCCVNLGSAIASVASGVRRADRSRWCYAAFVLATETFSGSATLAPVAFCGADCGAAIEWRYWRRTAPNI